MSETVLTERAIRFTVYGKPAPQGSKRAIQAPGQRFPSVVEQAGDKLKAWRAAITQAAGAAMEQHEMIDGPVRVEIVFHFLRPKGHFGTGKNSARLKPSAPEFHIQRPDADKLARAVLDGLTSRCYRDDSQVVELTAIKRWTDGQECAAVEVSRADYLETQGGNG